MSIFLTTEKPTESIPRRHMPRREVPHTHWHASNQSTWLDWLTVAAIASAVLWCFSTFGSWPV